MNNCLILFLLTYFAPAHAYNITVYTDQISNTKAQEVIALFKKTYPFNKFTIDLNIKTVKAGELDCKSVYGIERLINCESSKIAIEAAENGVDQVFIVKESSIYGGSGGSIPVITTSSSPRTLLHEFLHTLGLSDEYQYSAEEAKIYCYGDSTPNIAFIEPNPAGYTNDENARSLHNKKIPWYSSILPTTLITHNNQTQLGSGVVDSALPATQNTTDLSTKLGSAIGLYEGKTCKNATPPLRTWQPGHEATIMENLNAGFGVGYEGTIEKILISRGAQLKIIEEPKTLIEVNNQNRQPQEKSLGNLSGEFGVKVIEK